MNEDKDPIGDLLWKYIEERKNQGEDVPCNFVAYTSADPMEATQLLPLADALHETLHAGAVAAEGQEAARARLLEAIRTDRTSVASPLPRRLRPNRWSLSLRWGSPALLLVVLLLLAMVAAGYMGYQAWESYRASCQPAPAYSTPHLKPASESTPMRNTLKHRCS